MRLPLFRRLLRAVVPRRVAGAARVVAGLVLASALAGSARAEPTIGGLAIEGDGSLTRVTIASDADLAPRVAVETRPDRLVVDLPRARVAPAAEAEPNGFILGYRYGDLDAATTRLVFDVAAPFTVLRTARLPDGGAGTRLAIDLTPAASSPPGAAVALAPTPARPPSPPAASAPAPPAVVAAIAPPPLKPDRAAGRRRPVIVVDAGHGGLDPGAIGGAYGTEEKDVTLDVALALKADLEASGRYAVVLTRSSDVYVPLAERLRRAQEARGDLLISLHADSLPGRPDHAGLAVYTLSATASDARSHRLAARENADGMAPRDVALYDPDVMSWLADLALRDAGVRSEKFAARLASALGDRRRGGAPAERRSAGFVVLGSAEMPSVLLEMGYLSNREDEERLRSAVRRRDIVRAVVSAVDGALESNLFLTD